MADLEPPIVTPTHENIQGYMLALRRAIQKIQSENFNMLLVALPNHFQDEDYYRLKSICFNEKQVSQFFRLGTFRLQFPLVYWNLSVSLYAKMGGIPWTLALSPPVEKENIDVDLFIGICFVQRDAKSFVGVATVLTALSEHIITVSSKPVQYVGKQLHMKKEDIKQLVQECLKAVNFPVESVVIHYATPFNQDEIDGVREALVGIPEKTLVHLETESLTRIYSLDAPSRNVCRGTILELSDKRAILCTTGRCRILGTSPEIEDELEVLENGLETSFRYRGIGTPKPIGVNEIGDLPIEKVCRQILALTKLRWNTAEVNIRIPATIEFSRKVGYLSKYGIPHTIRGIEYIL